MLLAVIAVQLIASLSLVYAIDSKLFEFPVIFNPNGEEGEFEAVIYIDGDIWTNGTEIDFGDISAGEIVTVNLMVENNGDEAFEAHINVEDLDPSFTLEWTKDGFEVPVGLQVAGGLLLTAPDPIPSGVDGTCTLQILLIEPSP